MEIYLDNAATAKPDPEIIRLFSDTAAKLYGNPSSLHKKGMEAENAINASRNALIRLLCGNRSYDKYDLFFTSGGTEANNLAIRGFLSANTRIRKTFLTTNLEHPSVFEQIPAIENSGIQTICLRNNPNGSVDLDDLRSNVGPDTALVSIIAVNNETGVRQPLKEIVSIIKSVNPDTAVHFDAVQAFCKSDVDLAATGADLITVSSHKIHGLRGTGALLMNRKCKLMPIVYGGGQEKNLRSGTEDTAGIVCFAEAAKKAAEHFEEHLESVTAVRKLFLSVLADRSVYTGCVIMDPPHCSPYILSVSFPGLKSETIVHRLEMEDIIVSTGSACHSRRVKDNRILAAMGLTKKEQEGTVRISFSAYDTIDEIAQAASVMNTVATDLRQIFALKGKS